MAELKIDIKVDRNGVVQIKKLKSETDKLERSTKKATRANAGMSKSMATLAVRAGAVALAITAISVAVKGTVSSFIALENAQIGVQKTTGLADAEFARLNDTLEELSTTMNGVTIEGLLDIAEAAGQLGIQGVKDITEFTRVIGMVGLTTDLTAKEAATGFAKLSKQLQEPIENIEILASVFNELSNTTAATVGDLLGFSSFLAGAGKTVGLTTANIAGLSATMADLGINVESGGSAMSQVFLKMVGESDKFATALGIDATEYARILEDEPIEALNKLLDVMSTMSAGEQINLLTTLGLGGIRTSATILKISGATETLAKNLATANQEYETGTSIIKEYEVASQGLEAQLTKMNNAFTILSATLGERLKPALVLGSAATTEFLRTYTDQLNAFLLQFSDVKDVTGLQDINIKRLQLQRDLNEKLSISQRFMWNTDKVILRDRIKTIQGEIALLDKKSAQILSASKEEIRISEVAKKQAISKAKIEKEITEQVVKAKKAEQQANAVLLRQVANINRLLAIGEAEEQNAKDKEKNALISIDLIIAEAEETDKLNKLLAKQSDEIENIANTALKDSQNAFIKYYTTIGKHEEAWSLKSEQIFEEFRTRLGDEKALELAEAFKKNGLDKMKEDSKSTWEDMQKTIDNNLTSGFQDFFDVTSKGFGDLEKLGKSVINSIFQEIIRAQVAKPLAGFISSGFGSIFGSILESANGNVISNGEHVTAYANGGVVNSPTLFPMQNGTGLMGEAGSEAIMPLTRIGGDLGVKAIAGKTIINITNESGTPIDFEVLSETFDQEGNLTIDGLIVALNSNPDLRSAVKGVG